ncbi:mitochondrial 54S ribosomal protein YmL3 [Martiniozyma asiatica (nom. inval.)]|nr:mitochondrial 54S ribosomal protein YmL3 [Martiniozyma asiatica]
MQRLPKLSFEAAKFASFTKSPKITENTAIPSLLALHSRLRLPKQISTTHLANSLQQSNPQSVLGAGLLSYYVTEHLIAKYPRLPLSLLKHATDAYIGDAPLFDVAKNSWGIEADHSTQIDRFLNNEPQHYSLGKLNFTPDVDHPEPGITTTTQRGINEKTAFANAARAIFGYIHTEAGEIVAKEFIQNHILSRRLDLTKMFEFKEPGRLLAKLLKSQNLPAPTVKLISETGRQSNSPVYAVGCFSGDNLLASAEGSSLKEARTRAFVKSLMAWYLYQPINPTKPSDEETFNGLHIDAGEKFY